MNSAVRLARYLRLSSPASSSSLVTSQIRGDCFICLNDPFSTMKPSDLFAMSTLKTSRWSYSTLSSGADNEDIKLDDDEEVVVEENYDEILREKAELTPQGVDPRRGWGYRGVHKAIICGKVGLAPVQKILRNGRTVTIFTIGTGGLFDQRTLQAKDLPKPAQWHRIAVHNELLGAYAVQKLTKNSPVYVEGDIETRVYNDSITGQVKNIPEICIRRDGKIRLIKSGESVSKISFEDLREGLF